MSSDNALLGYWTCERGGRAEVRQTKKQGRHFYTKCDCCGLNQGTGAKRQQEIWDSAEFVDKSVVARPLNVVIDAVAVNEPAPKVEAPKVDPVGDFNPTAEPVVSPPSEQKNGFVKFVPGLVLLAAAGVGAWLS